MSSVTFRGVVLNIKETSENNLSILILARNLGKVWLVARGAKKATSKLLSSSQIFSYGDFTCFSGKGFYSLTGAEIIDNFYSIRVDIEKLSQAVYLSCLVSSISQEGLEQNDIMKLFLYTLKTIEKSELSPGLISRIFELKLLQLTGFFPNINNGINDIYFDGENALFTYTKNTQHTFLILPGVLKAIRFVLSRDIKGIFMFKLSDESYRQLDLILRKFIELHLEISLKSRSFSDKL